MMEVTRSEIGFGNLNVPILESLFKFKTKNNFEDNFEISIDEIMQNIDLEQLIDKLRISFESLDLFKFVLHDFEKSTRGLITLFDDKFMVDNRKLEILHP